jgi:hypothetical protein
MADSVPRVLRIELKVCSAVAQEEKKLFLDGRLLRLESSHMQIIIVLDKLVKSYITLSNIMMITKAA